MGTRSIAAALSLAFGIALPLVSCSDTSGSWAHVSGATSTGGALAHGGGTNHGGHASGAPSSSGGSSTFGGSSSSGGASTFGGSSTSGGALGAGGSSGSAAFGGSHSGAGGVPAVGGSMSSSGGGSGSAGTSTSGLGGNDARGGSGSGGSGGSPATGGSAGAAGSTSCPGPVPGSSGKNPLFTDQYTADPAPLVHGCKFYIACGHDQGQTGFVMREWFLLSSSDMVNWSKQVALSLSAFTWADANAWAGQIVERGGKFYWYVPVNKRGSGMAIGVAVADSLDGPFKDAIGKPLIDDATEMANWGFSDPGQTPFTIDPTVFVDDDGQAYLHYGGFSRMVAVKLNDDMISLNGKMTESTPPGFFEAPYLLKRNGRYYELYASGINPAAIDYATSTTPMGPWTRGGRVLDPLPNVPGQDAATNHAGVAEFNGQWYIVYHLSNGPNSGGTYKREVAVEKLTFSSSGSIQKVTPSSGLSF